MRYNTKLFIVLLAAMFTQAVTAQPVYISGDLSGTLEPGSYIVTGDCFVPADQTLSLQPGTTFLFAGHFTLNVYGRLIADGTAADSIKFLRQFPTEACKHGGITFHPGSSVNNSLSFCRVDYAYNPDFPDIFGGGVLVYGSGVSIRNSLFTNCKAHYGGAIYISESTAVISACGIYACQALSRGGAVYTIHSSTLIEDCEIIQNTADLVPGICIYDNDDAEVRYSTVAHNIATSTAG
jgi:hypothetical protein